MSKTACQYAIVRFSPFVETGEFANVGIVLMAARQGYFGFRLATRRYGRITRFFDELEPTAYRATMQELRAELTRVHELIKAHGFDGGLKGNDPDLAAHMFAEVVRVREGMVRFSAPRAVLAEDPQDKLQELFAYYVQRNFVTRKYREAVLEDSIRGWLRQAALQARFKSATLGDDEYEVNFPFVAMEQDRAIKVIKPLHLAQERPTDIIEHGASWAFRMQQLRLRGRFPEQMLFAVDDPAERPGSKRQRAYDDAHARLRDTGAMLVRASQRDRVLEFAAA